MRRQSFTRSRIRYTRWAAVAALVPLALAGCSSGSDDTASEGAAGTDASRTITINDSGCGG